MVNGKLAVPATKEVIHIYSIACGTELLRRGLGNANPISISGPSGNPRRDQCKSPRLHEVDVRMMLQNAFQPLSNEAANAFPVPRPGMAIAAEALSKHRATVSGSSRAAVATIIARRRLSRMHPRARRIFNVNAHADRRAPPGGDPGRSRQGKSDRGI